MKTIEERWHEFRRRVMDPDVPEPQLSEMRIAFYAGFKAMLDANMEIAMLDNVPAVRELERLQNEARRFRPLNI
jgi:hypothetical protein